MLSRNNCPFLGPKHVFFAKMKTQGDGEQTGCTRQYDIDFPFGHLFPARCAQIFLAFIPTHVRVKSVWDILEALKASRRRTAGCEARTENESQCDCVFGSGLCFAHERLL